MCAWVYMERMPEADCVSVGLRRWPPTLEPQSGYGGRAGRAWTAARTRSARGRPPVRQIVTATASAYVATANEIAIYARTVLSGTHERRVAETAYRAARSDRHSSCSGISCSMELGCVRATRQQSLVELESALGGPAIAPSDAELPSLTTQESHR